jgi:cell cycle checkpoint protein
MSLNEVWEAAAGSPFHPAIPKERQFVVGFSLLLTGISSATYGRLEGYADSQQLFY